MSWGIPGFARAQAAYEAQEPDEDFEDDCRDLTCGVCGACKQAEREDEMECRAEQAREDARFD